MLVALTHGRLLVARSQSSGEVVVLVPELDRVPDVLELAALVLGEEELPDLTRQLDLLRRGAGRSVQVAGQLLTVVTGPSPVRAGERRGGAA